MMDETRRHPKKDARGKRPEFFATPEQDQVMSMVMVLANELSVLHDRLDSVERVAKANNLDLAAGIDALELDQAALEEREAWRQGFLERLFYLMRKDAAEAAAAETSESYKKTIDDIAIG